MSYRNTMKLFASNFNFVWKQLVYILGCLLLLVLCSYTTIKPIIDVLTENNIAAEFEILYKSLYDSSNEIALLISGIFKKIIIIIANNFSEIYLSLIFAILLCVLLPLILVNMSIYNLSSIAYQKVTMNMTPRYSQNTIRTLKPAIKYAFASILFSLPFMGIDLALIMLYIAFADSIIAALIGLIILSALTMFVQSIKLAIFAHYTGLVVSGAQTNSFKAFAKAFAEVFKNFWKYISSSIILYLTIVVVNSFVMVFTFFAGLLVSIPATFVVMAFYYVVSYLNAAGQRYYLSDTIIYNPVKHIVKKDDFVTISIPEVEKEVQVETTKVKKSYKKQKSK